jgi:hypothetical protein
MCEKCSKPKLLAIMLMTNKKADHYCYWRFVDSCEQAAEWINQRTEDLKEDEIFYDSQVDEITALY